jgi:hypothetical protein
VATAVEVSAIQTYATTISARGFPDFRFLSVPVRAIREPADLEDLMSVLDLGEEVELREFRPASLASALWVCVRGEDPEQNELVSPSEFPDDEQRLYGFAEYLAFAELIPFEASAQRSISLGAIMVAGAGVGAKTGAAAGVVIGAPGGPVVIVTTAAGFVLGGVVGAVTAAVGENVYDRLRPRNL